MTIAPCEKPFLLASEFDLTGDQPMPSTKLQAGLEQGYKHQTLLGVTGSGKTFTMANVIARDHKPTLVISPNKTLAAQLTPSSATSSRRTRWSTSSPITTTTSRKPTSRARTPTSPRTPTSTRRSTSSATPPPAPCLSTATSSSSPLSPASTAWASRPSTTTSCCNFKVGETSNRARALRRLVDMQYERNDQNLVRGRFRIRGDSITVLPAYEELAVRIDFFGEEVERILQLDPLTGEVLAEMDSARHLPRQALRDIEDKLEAAIKDIEAEMAERTRSSRSAASCSKPSDSLSARATTSSACGSRATAPASRTTRRHLSAPRPRAAHPGRCWTTSPTTRCCSSTSRTRRFRRSAACTSATSAASRRSSTSASACLRPSTTGRSASRSSRPTSTR